MCGFAALFEPGRLFEPELLTAMDADLFHRGPDSNGTTSEAGFGLVFRRLAILDPTAAADQPMHDAERRCSLVFNGEIYNYRSVREELEANGIGLRTSGDTEAILEGYRLWGEDVLDRIEGMYAFVLVDRDRGIALIARDPLGIKPLYALRRGGLFAVASEMHPLRRLHETKPDATALAELLTFGWAAGRLSNLEGIDRVPGGTLLKVSLRDGAVCERRFFDPLGTLHVDEWSNPQDIEQKVAQEFKDSVAAHLASDVGYTAQLSGGLDSSLVTAIASKHTKSSIATFGVKLEDPRYDESKYRATLVDRFNLEHHEAPISGEVFADALPTAIRHMEGPVPHGGCVMLMLLCKEARKRSKVVLTGEGADEMFGGYLRYANWSKLQSQEWLGHILPKRLTPPIWPFFGIRRLGRLDAAVYASVYHDFHAMNRLFPGLIAKPGARETASRRFHDFRNRMFAVDQAAYLESLLVRQDKMSMSQSVEARVPFVHLPLLKVVNSLPHAVRAPGATTKPVLKRLADRYLPKELVHRRKVGLLLPYDDWLADDKALGRYLGELTSSSARLRPYAKPGELQHIVDAYRKGQRRGLPSLFWLINIELWLQSVEFQSNPIAA